MSVAQATVTQKVSLAPVIPKYGFPFPILILKFECDKQYEGVEEGRKKWCLKNCSSRERVNTYVSVHQAPLRRA